MQESFKVLGRPRFQHLTVCFWPGQARPQMQMSACICSSCWTGL